MDNRIEALDALLNLKKPLKEVTNYLVQFPWDYQEESAILEIGHIRRVLERYLAGELSEAFVENWAGTIESRDDICLDKQDENFIKELIHEMANPYLTEKLTYNRAKILIQDIKEEDIKRNII